MKSGPGEAAKTETAGVAAATGKGDKV